MRPELKRGHVVRVKRLLDDHGGMELTWAVRPRSKQRLILIFMGTEGPDQELDVEQVLREMGWTIESECTPDCQKMRLARTEAHKGTRL